MREENLEVAVAARSNRDDVLHGDAIFEGALSRVKNEELIGVFYSCRVRERGGEGGRKGGREGERGREKEKEE